MPSCIVTSRFLTHSEVASGFKKFINGDLTRRVFIEEESAQREKCFLMGRQVAWMIYEYFKVSDTDESFLDLSEILKVDLKNANVQS